MNERVRTSIDKCVMKAYRKMYKCLNSIRIKMHEEMIRKYRI